MEKFSLKFIRVQTTDVETTDTEIERECTVYLTCSCYETFMKLFSLHVKKCMHDLLSSTHSKKKKSKESKLIFPIYSLLMLLTL